MTDDAVGGEWYAPYYVSHINGKWRISRARLDGKWRYTLWAMNKEGTNRMVGTYDNLEQAKENAT